MNIKRINLVYFSPNGKTKEVLNFIAKGINIEVKEYDLTDFDARWKKYEFDQDELVILGLPVYSNRIPSNKTEIFRGLKGNNTPLVGIVSYGNVEYGDALLELTDCAKERGFACVAAGACITEHTLSDKLGFGRPNVDDANKLAKFGHKVIDKLSSINTVEEAILDKVKGNFPYAKVSPMPFGPSTNDNCENCMICAKNCPMKAINPLDAKDVDGFRCINCGRCVKNCPKQAKGPNEMIAERMQGLIAMLEGLHGSTEKVNKLFV